MSKAQTKFLQQVTEYQGKLDQNEHREQEYGLINWAMAQTMHPNSIISDDLRNKAQNTPSTNVALRVPVVNDVRRATGTTTTCDPDAPEITTALVDVQFTPIVQTIKVVSASSDMNYISTQQDFERQLTGAIADIKTEMETRIGTAVDLAKSTATSVTSSFVGAGKKYGAMVGDSIQVSQALQDRYFNDVTVIGMENNFRPNFDVVGSTSLMSDVNHYLNQGAGNSTNLSYQFQRNGLGNFYFSNTVPAAEEATGYFMQQGQFGILSRLRSDYLNRMNADNVEWFTATLPGIPFPVGVKRVVKCADNSGMVGGGSTWLESSHTEAWEIFVDFATVSAYNPDPVTKSSGIFKFDFLNA